jgi:signal transduction histidine kinase
MGMYLVCVLLESEGILAPASLVATPARADMPPAVVACFVGMLMFISGAVWYLASRLANALRHRDGELARTNRRLVAATEERLRHMLRTTHQLKAPFAAIHAHAQLLLGGYCGPVPERALVTIRQMARRCATLSREITDMLQLANLRSDAQATPPVILLELSALIRACQSALEPQAEKRGIVFDGDLSETTVLAVRDHAMMILDNLLTNAVSYSRDGQAVSVACHPAPDGGARVVIRDRGIGIPPEKLPRIFEDYFRTNEAVQHNGASTGLGLAIVRQAALVGGIGVRVESAVNEGTVFSLTFPAFPASPGSPANSEESTWHTS